MARAWHEPCPGRSCPRNTRVTRSHAAGRPPVRFGHDPGLARVMSRSDARLARSRHICGCGAVGAARRCRPMSAVHRDRMRLDGKVAVITGAGGGIGRAIAVEFAGAGAKLVLVGRNTDMLGETAAALDGGDTRVVAADVSRSGDVRRVVEEATTAYGTIDVLVANHGIEGPVTRLVDYPEDDFDRV